jgi:RNA polymerase sigma-70 factor (ECF subfamily)
LADQAIALRFPAAHNGQHRSDLWEGLAPMLDNLSTRTSLLERLRNPADQVAWADFVRRYGQQIYRWCRRWDLQTADAEDLTQIVLTKLAEKMSTFRYDPARSFRAYLKTLTHHAWCDLLEKRKRSPVGTGDTEMVLLLDNVEAREDLARQLAAEFDAELLDEAMQQVRQRVEPHTWDAFRLTALEGLSAADAAAQLNIRVASVFQAKSRVQRMLQEVLSQEEGP